MGDPSGHGAALFAFFAGMAESEREYIREKSLEGQASARECGRHGRPKVFDDNTGTGDGGRQGRAEMIKCRLPHDEMREHRGT
ncbi:recombinase family protein [Nonomuraea guangzhouensis]|uniref:Recombinase family protein n=1 Tax=Nonomuraea guangzhouensis TaxID=1291555 RepID=A0ABW4GLK8_9ACTN|nr:recombinase family protein [Nonomuraea guangzhouensis]